MLNVGQDFLSLKSRLYGILQGKNVYKFTLQNECMSVDITNLGCSIAAIYTPGRNGIQKNIVAGFEDLKAYENNRDYFGCVLGRYANRIAGGCFFLEGKEINLSVNDSINHLHGGVEGFNKKIWDVGSVIQKEEQVYVELEYLSRDGEEGYPGNLHVKVKYILNNKNQLCIEYRAYTDKATPVSLSNHSYFNLSGFENPLITGHALQINAISYTEKNKFNVPTGNILPVSDSPLDFRKTKTIGDHINCYQTDKGFDHNFILKDHDPGEIVLAAQLKDPESGRTLKVYTDRPGIQLYTANFWDGTILGQQGQLYQKHGGVALETQAFPNSPNHPSFPNTILNPGQHYFSTTIYEFGIE
jgi:aldose 1-epimerase